ncbi:MAG: tetratricopeptide repeat protein [Caldilineaceae bacterium]
MTTFVCSGSACETQQIPLIRLAFMPLAHFYDGTARYVEGKALYAAALAAFDLQPDAPPATQPWLLAGLLIAYGNMLERLGEYAAAGAAVQRALAIVQAHDHADGITYALLLLGRIALNQGEFARAEDWLRQGWPSAGSATMSAARRGRCCAWEPRWLIRGSGNRRALAMKRR